MFCDCNYALRSLGIGDFGEFAVADVGELEFALGGEIASERIQFGAAIGCTEARGKYHRPHPQRRCEQLLDTADSFCQEQPRAQAGAPALEITGGGERLHAGEFGACWGICME